MANMALFERAAARELTPEAAVLEMAEREATARRNARPQWMPAWLLAIGTFAVGALLIFLGIPRREN